MPGRTPKWDFAFIAERYSSFYRQPGEPKVSAATVKQEISKRPELFERLVVNEPSEAAYSILLRILAKQLDEKEYLKQAGGLRMPLLQGYEPSRRYRAALPSWFIGIARAWLRWHDKQSSAQSEVAREREEAASLSLHIASYCLEDERFMWAAGAVKRIWRIGYKFRTPEPWYRWLHAQQTAAVEHVLPEDSRKPWKERELWHRGQGRHLANPLDDRGVQPTHLYGPYDLPIQDYKYHVRQLTLLAGGDPQSDYWEHWIETLLWDGRPLLGSAGWGQGEAQPTWLRNGFLSPVFPVGRRSLASAPPVEPGLQYRQDASGLNEAPKVYLPSRWSSLRSFPREFRQDLVIAAIRTWGAYTEPLSHRQRVARLRSAVSPERQRRVARQQVLEDLWEQRGDELEKLPVAQQARAEQLAVRRAADRRRRAEARSKRRLQ